MLEVIPLNKGTTALNGCTEHFMILKELNANLIKMAALENQYKV